MNETLNASLSKMAAPAPETAPALKNVHAATTNDYAAANFANTANTANTAHTANNANADHTANTGAPSAHSLQASALAVGQAAFTVKEATLTPPDNQEVIAPATWSPTANPANTNTTIAVNTSVIPLGTGDGALLESKQPISQSTHFISGQITLRLNGHAKRVQEIELSDKAQTHYEMEPENCQVVYEDCKYSITVQFVLDSKVSIKLVSCTCNNFELGYLSNETTTPYFGLPSSNGTANTENITHTACNANTNSNANNTSNASNAYAAASYADPSKPVIGYETKGWLTFTTPSQSRTPLAHTKTSNVGYPFAMLCEVAMFTLILSFEDGSKLELYSPYLLCANKNQDNNDNIQQMLQKLADFDNSVIGGWLFPNASTNLCNQKTSLIHRDITRVNPDNKDESSQSQNNTHRSLKSYLQLLEEIVNCYQTNLVYFSRMGKHSIRRETMLQSPLNVKSLTVASFQWLMQNSDQLAPVNTNKGIYYRGQNYVPLQMVSEVKIKSSDVYENHVVVSFLNVVLNNAKHIWAELKDSVSENSYKVSTLIKTQNATLNSLQPLSQDGINGSYSANGANANGLNGTNGTTSLPLTAAQLAHGAPLDQSSISSHPSYLAQSDQLTLAGRAAQSLHSAHSVQSVQSLQDYANANSAASNLSAVTSVNAVSANSVDDSESLDDAEPKHLENYVSSIAYLKTQQLELSQGLLQRLDSTIENLNNLLGQYLNMFKLKPDFTLNMPRKTKTFQEIKPYTQVFAMFLKWRDYGEFRLEKDKLLMRVKTLNQLFEYYCLIGLLEMLQENGYTLAPMVTLPVIQDEDIAKYQHILSARAHTMAYAIASASANGSSANGGNAIWSNAQAITMANGAPAFMSYIAAKGLDNQPIVRVTDEKFNLLSKASQITSYALNLNQDDSSLSERPVHESSLGHGSGNAPASASQAALSPHASPASPAPQALQAQQRAQAQLDSQVTATLVDMQNGTIALKSLSVSSASDANSGAAMTGSKFENGQEYCQEHGQTLGPDNGQTLIQYNGLKTGRIEPQLKMQEVQVGPIYTFRYQQANGGLFKPEDNLPNTFVLRKGNVEVTLYYQPVISASEFQNRLALYRTTNPNAIGDYYSPDFVLKFVRKTPAPASKGTNDGKHTSASELQLKLQAKASTSALALSSSPIAQPGITSAQANTQAQDNTLAQDNAQGKPQAMTNATGQGQIMAQAQPHESPNSPQSQAQSLKLAQGQAQDSLPASSFNLDEPVIEENYVILDSKFASRKNIHEYHLDEVIRKYSTQVAVNNESRTPKMVWILQGRVDSNEEPLWKFHSSRLASLYRPATSIGIVTMNANSNNLQQFWQEMQGQIPWI